MIALLSNDSGQYTEPSLLESQTDHSIIYQIIPKQIFDQTIENSISSLQKSSKNYSYDILIENERGLILFGLPFYTKYLFPHYDPPNLSNLNGNQITNLKLFPLPDLNWNWTWDKWYIIMNEQNTDDQGWSYSSRFGSKNWRCIKNWYCFVRRRLWLRLREIDIVNEVSNSI